jgi:RND family efflux transporter MFP subunit
LKKHWELFNIKSEKFEMEKTIYRICLFGLGVISAVACSDNKSAQQHSSAAIPVVIYQLKPQEALFYNNFPATVAALNQVDLRSEVSGYITDISFKDGQLVKKGMKLYSVDQQQYKAVYEQAVANLNSAKANLMKAQQDADRYAELARYDAIAKQVQEHAEADLESAKMQVVAAEKNVNSVQTNLRYSVIEAPFDGIIGISLVKLGSSVTGGQTQLNTISSVDPIAVDFAVDEKLIGRFSELMENKTGGRDSLFTLVLPDGKLYPYPGQISLIDRAVDSQTGTIKIRLIFSNPKNILKPGLTCNVRVKNSSGGNTLLIPFKAVTEQMSEYFVFVLAGNKVSQRRIIIGDDINGMVIVKEGLQPGDQIVIDGIQKIKDNSEVSAVSDIQKQSLLKRQ